METWAAKEEAVFQQRRAHVGGLNRAYIPGVDKFGRDTGEQDIFPAFTPHLLSHGG
jgi:hypothetical protein